MMYTYVIETIEGNKYITLNYEVNLLTVLSYVLHIQTIE